MPTLREYNQSGHRIQEDEFLDQADTQGILSDGFLEDPDVENAELVQAATTMLNNERRDTLRWFYYEGWIYLVPEHIALTVGHLLKQAKDIMGAQDRE